MVSRIEVIPSEVRGYGDILGVKTLSDFTPVESDLTLTTGVYTLSALEGVRVSLTVSSGSVTYGSSVTLTATVMDGSTPVTGETVTFYDGETSLGTDTTDSSGVATLSTSSLSVATHSITAVYDDLTSSAVNVVVNKIASTISLLAASSTVTYGNNVSLSGTLSVGSGESVKIYNGTTLVDTVTTSTGGAFSKSISGLSVGTYSFTAVYEGDSTHSNVTSSAANVSVTKITSTLSLSASSSSITYGNSVTLSGTLSLGSGYSVKLYKDGTLLDTITTGTGGAYSKTVTGLTPSMVVYTFSAEYEGDSTHEDSTSSNVSVNVSKATPTITLSVPSTGTTGTAYTVSGTLSVDGTVKLYEGSSLKDTLTVSSGSFSKSITQSAAGTYSYYAVFEATSNYNSVTSSTGSIVVSDVAPSYDGVSLTSNKSVLSYADSDSCTLTAQLLSGSSSASVSGVTVEFFKGSTSLGTATTNASGVATKSYSSAGSGDISLTAEADSYTSTALSITDYWNVIPLDNTTDNKITGTYTVGTIQSKTGLSRYGTDTHLSQSTFPSKFTITGELLKTSTYASYILLGTNKDNGYMVGFDGSANSFSGYVRSNGSNSGRIQKSSISTNTWYPFTITVNGTSLTFVSNNLTITGTIPVNSISYIGWYNNSNSGYWRDLKIKAL